MKQVFAAKRRPCWCWLSIGLCDGGPAARRVGERCGPDPDHAARLFGNAVLRLSL